MSTLRSGLEELQADDLRFVPDDALEADLAEIERAAGILEAERARRVAEAERRGSFRRDGYLSVASWLAHRLRISFSSGTRCVRWARALEQMRLTRDSLASGDVSSCAAAVLVAAMEANPDEFARIELTLVEAARTLSIRDLVRVVAYWRQAAEGAASERESERRFELRRLHVSPALDGMVRVDGDLDPETGQVLLTALRSVLDAEARLAQDRRTSAQRRADALAEICRRHLDSADRPLVAGERPHVTVTVALEGRMGRRCELDDVGPITPEMARRWACDSSIARIVTVGESQPLDIGRRTPVVSPALRRAVNVRDGRCRFPGCERPHAWCDAHHIRHWADGGPTASWNLILLCRPHHRLVHQGFAIELVDGSPRFSRPDGTPLEDRAPPSTNWT